LTASTTTKLADFYFQQKHGDRLVTTAAIHIIARDGMQLNALVLRPKGVDGPVPMVVKVHGGAAHHVEWEYNLFRQFLVNRGYALLALNSRGSDGSGNAYKAAGFGEYGRKMQDDVVDATNWAVDQGIADPNALAIMGSNYGGYAAAMALIRDLALFKAAIIEHAMLYVAYQSQYPPHSWGLHLALWQRYFGNVENPDGPKQMQQRFPMAKIDCLQAATLMVAGKRDGVISFGQAEKFIKQVKAANKKSIV
jgi:dipeptidyl aminopeptidase/acylaminoacyl peptidase